MPARQSTTTPILPTVAPRRRLAQPQILACFALRITNFSECPRSCSLPSHSAFYQLTSMATGLFASLPKPKYTGEHEEVPQHARPTGPRVVGPDTIDESQIVLRRSGPPPYGQRSGWRPRSQEDFGDGRRLPPKCQWLNTRWTWARKANPQRQMHWQYKSMLRAK